MGSSQCVPPDEETRNLKSDLITKEHMEALLELKRNPSILICHPDKGSGIVLMNRAEYIDRLNHRLGDGVKFQKVADDKDRTIKIEQQVTECLKKLKREGCIDGNLFD